MQAMNQMLSENHVSPRTYDTKKIELECWMKNEREEISHTRKALERGLLKAMESIKKTQRDVQLAQRFQNNPQKFDSRSSFASEEEQMVRRKMELEGNSNRSDSETHSDNLSSSQALKYLLKEMGTPASKNNIKIIDRFELKERMDGENDDWSQDENKQPSQKSSQEFKKGKVKNSIYRKYNKLYADGDHDGDEDDEERHDSEKKLRGFGERQNSPQVCMRVNLENANTPDEDQDQDQEEEGQISPQTIEHTPSLQQKKEQTNHGMKLILDYNDFDKAKLAKEQSSPHTFNNMSSEQQQGQEVEKIIKLNPLVAKKSPRLEETPQIPFSEKQFNQEGTIDSDRSQRGVNSEEPSSASAGGKSSTSKRSPRELIGNLKETHSEEDEIDELKFYEEKEFQEKQIAIQQLSSPTAEFMERTEILAEMQDKWRTFNQIDSRIQEQLQRLFALDKSESYGISTNIKILTDYIDNLFAYVTEHYKEEFLSNLNTPFGFAPSKRLKLIHGYDSFVDSSCSDEGSSEDYNTLPFVLSEELFIEFEQNIIGNGETEKEQIIKEFEHIHNKAIFDTFNEALNIFRPFYTLGGPPYSWTKSEKNLVLGKATNKNLHFILDKSKTRVVEWSSYLCGLVNEEEVPRQLPLEDEKGNPPPLSVLLENLTPQNEYLAQVREERLSKMLLTEIFENEYKWQLYEDEKTEVVMELADLVFEELVEEVVNEMPHTIKSVFQ